MNDAVQMLAKLARFWPVLIFLGASAFGIEGRELAERIAAAANAEQRIQILHSLSAADLKQKDVIAVLHSLVNEPGKHGLPSSPESGSADLQFACDLVNQILSLDPLSPQTLARFERWRFLFVASHLNERYEFMRERVIDQALARPKEFSQSLTSLLASPELHVGADALFLLKTILTVLSKREARFLQGIDEASSLGAELVNDRVKAAVREYAHRLPGLASTYDFAEGWFDLTHQVFYRDPCLAIMLRSEIKQFASARPLGDYGYLLNLLMSLQDLDPGNPENLQLALQLYRAVSDGPESHVTTQRLLFEVVRTLRNPLAADEVPGIFEFKRLVKSFEPGRQEDSDSYFTDCGVKLAGAFANLKESDRALALSFTIRFLKDHHRHLGARKIFITFVAQLHQRGVSPEILTERKICRVVIARLGLPPETK